MKLNPVFSVSAILAFCTFAFLWAVTPRSTSEHFSNSQKTQRSQLVETISLSQAQKARVAAFAEDWATSPAYEADFNALDPSYKVSSISNSLFDPSDDYWGLPRDDKGSFELVDAYCTACHSLNIVMQQRATPERWKELLIWMEDKQGMAKIPSTDEALVLEYISTHFSTQSN